MQHTKGEWRIDTTDGCPSIYSNDGYWIIADLINLTERKGIADETMANAQIISAAPNMYEVLEEMVANGWSAKIQEKAKKALQKAKEENQ